MRARGPCRAHARLRGPEGANGHALRFLLRDTDHLRGKPCPIVQLFVPLLPRVIRVLRVLLRARSECSKGAGEVFVVARGFEPVCPGFARPGAAQKDAALTMRVPSVNDELARIRG